MDDLDKAFKEYEILLKLILLACLSIPLGLIISQIFFN